MAAVQILKTDKTIHLGKNKLNLWAIKQLPVRIGQMSVDALTIK